MRAAWVLTGGTVQNGRAHRECADGANRGAIAHTISRRSAFPQGSGTAV